MNQVVIWNDLRLFIGSNPRAITEHSHPIIQFVVSLQGSFLSKTVSGNWIKKKGLLIAPNYFHECDAKNISIISIDIDPKSTLGEWILHNQLRNLHIKDYPSEGLEILEVTDFSLNLKNENWQSVRNMIENTFLFNKTFKKTQKDERISKILEFIRNNITQNITTKNLTEITFLSESRMLHLFKEEMGLPIRNYILWYRLKIVIDHILEGNSLTSAAYKAGFSDQAHMTRTFTKMTGLPPSLLIKNSKFVQVSFPN